MASRPSQSSKNLHGYEEDAAAMAIAEYAAKFNALTPMLEKKQHELENALVLRQLIFDIEEQLKWIDQTLLQLELLTSKPLQTLFDATNVHKKLGELERSLLNNHKPNVDKLLNQSKVLLASSGHDDELALKTEQLESEWLRLLREVETRKLVAARALSEQQCLDELNQIMLSLGEKWLIIENADVMQSQDETLLSKHLAKLNQLKDDLKGYNVCIIFLLKIFPTRIMLVLFFFSYFHKGHSKSNQQRTSEPFKINKHSSRIEIPDNSSRVESNGRADRGKEASS